MSTSKSKLRSKNVLIVAILTFGVRSIILVASSIAQASAQQHQQYHHRMMRWSEEGIPHINGSVSLANKTSNFINENVRLQFIAAAQNAQGRVANETVFDRHRDTVQGLSCIQVLRGKHRNSDGVPITMDSRNGKEVLCTLDGQPLGSFDQSSMHGHLGGGHDYEGLVGEDLGKGNSSEYGKNAILR
jgi:hypothetical protein